MRSHVSRFFVVSLAGILLVSLLFIHCKSSDDINILIPEDANPSTQTYAKEIRKYIYLRTTILPGITNKKGNGLNHEIHLISKENVAEDLLPYELYQQYSLLEPGCFLIYSKKGSDTEKKKTIIAGSDDLGLQYGTYKFIELLGVTFHLHGDIVPCDKIAYSVSDTTIIGIPLFRLRGILPFHDFPEGPDWWTKDDYKAIIAQLPKMGMNFIGFHTYPEKFFGGWEKAEPMVWIGLQDQVNNNGSVSGAYPVLHSHTMDSTWGYSPKKTSDFIGGASQIFDTDNYGAPYMKQISPWPHTKEENIKIFNDFGKLQYDIFSFANKLGVKTCIGTETPLTIPVEVKRLISEKGLDPDSDTALEMVYRGIFERVKKTHPLDYYWFWTPEYWTWEGESKEAVHAVERDLFTAIAAKEELNSNFELATCGWVLGPKFDRTYFDDILPKDLPFSCINREQGFSPVEPDFEKIEGREKWQISWIEDDPAMISPQLWSGRIRKDAVDALKYGCDGFMGIHWRTRILNPGFETLAQCGWSFGDWAKSQDSNNRDLPVEDFYIQWAKSEFGEEHSVELGRLFSALDGGPMYIPGVNQRTANLMRTSDWAGTGPGGIKILYEPWSETSKRFEFIDKLHTYRDSINGLGNLSRFNYWLKTFQYSEKLAFIGTLLGQIEGFMDKISLEPNLDKKKAIIKNQIIPLRSEIGNNWNNMVTLLLETVETRGEMGTIANLELHNLENLRMLNKYDDLLSQIYGEALPPYNFSFDYRGKDRIIVPSKRTMYEKGEPINIEVLVLSGSKIGEVSLYWRKLGNKSFRRIPAQWVNRNVYLISLTEEKIPGDGVEYYIEVKNETTRLLWPETVPEVYHSFIIGEL